VGRGEGRRWSEAREYTPRARGAFTPAPMPTASPDGPAAPPDPVHVYADLLSLASRGAPPFPPAAVPAALAWARAAAAGLKGPAGEAAFGADGVAPACAAGADRARADPAGALLDALAGALVGERPEGLPADVMAAVGAGRAAAAAATAAAAAAGVAAGASFSPLASLADAALASGAPLTELATTPRCRAAVGAAALAFLTDPAALAAAAAARLLAAAGRLPPWTERGDEDADWRAGARLAAAAGPGWAAAAGAARAAVAGEGVGEPALPCAVDLPAAFDGARLLRLPPALVAAAAAGDARFYGVAAAAAAAAPLSRESVMLALHLLVAGPRGGG